MGQCCRCDWLIADASHLQCALPQKLPSIVTCPVPTRSHICREFDIESRNRFSRLDDEVFLGGKWAVFFGGEWALRRTAIVKRNIVMIEVAETLFCVAVLCYDSDLLTALSLRLEHNWLHRVGVEQTDCDADSDAACIRSHS